jgi:hypothetical protein
MHSLCVCIINGVMYETTYIATELQIRAIYLETNLRVSTVFIVLNQSYGPELQACKCCKILKYNVEKVGCSSELETPFLNSVFKLRF